MGHCFQELEELPCLLIGKEGYVIAIFLSRSPQENLERVE
jgi:hypothetical protein